MKLHWPLLVFAMLLAFMLSDQNTLPSEPLANGGQEHLASLTQHRQGKL